MTLVLVDKDDPEGTLGKQKSVRKEFDSAKIVEDVDRFLLMEKN